MGYTVRDVAALVKGEIEGDASLAISGLNGFDQAERGEITFASSAKFLSRLAQTKADCVLVPTDFEGDGSKTMIRVPEPKTAFFVLLSKFHRPERPAPGIHPTAVVDDSARLGADVHVGPYAVIGAETVIGDRVIIETATVVGRRTRVGNDCHLHPSVTLYRDVTIGNHVVIHSGAVVGADGFGYVVHEGRQVKVPQLGTVVIEDHVEIGANVAIDRATFGATRIMEGVKVDNLCQVAHNVVVGRHTILAGQVGVAGSTKIGNNCVVAAQAGLADNLVVGDRCVVGGKTGVTHSLPEGMRVFGTPAREISQSKRQIAAIARLTKHVRTLVSMAKERESADVADTKDERTSRDDHVTRL